MSVYKDYRDAIGFLAVLVFVAVPTAIFSWYSDGSALAYVIPGTVGLLVGVLAGWLIPEWDDEDPPLLRVVGSHVRRCIPAYGILLWTGLRLTEPYMLNDIGFTMYNVPLGSLSLGAVLGDALVQGVSLHRG